eukprot:TRINITY_DN3192_c1_g2_i1.p1 TRINITY_DN3192_c1_g2~~TRINITY_DN3192_c1_g2_i1.p1  ORF type:complete len:189 (+),score=37.73 TRINITY_DN3192_c1_g2_i1:68-568(+)
MTGSSNNSWVGFYKSCCKDNEYLFYKYLSKLEDDTYIMEIPFTNGEYEFRSFINRYQPSAKSHIIRVNNQDKIEVLVQSEEKFSVERFRLVVNCQIATFDPKTENCYFVIKRDDCEQIIKREVIKKPKEVKILDIDEMGKFNAYVYVGSDLKIKSKTFVVQSNPYN